LPNNTEVSGSQAKAGSKKLGLFKLSQYNFRDLVYCQPEISAFEAAVKMDSHHVGCILVKSKEGKVLGIVTRYDFVHNLVVAGRDPKTTAISEVMHANPVTVDADATSIDALSTMIKSKVERLVVVSRSTGKIFGIISLEDVVGTLEGEAFSSLSHEKFDQIFDMVRRLTPNLLSRYEGEERIELERDLNNELKALMRLLQEVEVSLRP
jgi:signal-transduction protein with cAMP-binding, CBS, and nucleotidyltransferase domain